MKTITGRVGTDISLRKRPATILVIEDNDDQWFLTRWAILHTLSGVNFVRTSNTLDTLSYLAGCTYDHRPLPDLILLDLYLPDREEGWSLLETLKQQSAYHLIPVVTLSNSAALEDIEESYYRRSASYVVKPTSYPDWLTCFEGFRRYWFDSVTLPKVTTA